MRKLITFCVSVLLAAAASAQVPVVNGNGAVINGPTVVVQKPTYGEFRGGVLEAFLKPTKVRMELRTGTARGDIVTVTTRHQWLPNERLYRIESRDCLAIIGNDTEGYVVLDTNRVWLRLYPCGDTFILDAE